MKKSIYFLRILFLLSLLFLINHSLYAGPRFLIKIFYEDGTKQEITLSEKVYDEIIEDESGTKITSFFNELNIDCPPIITKISNDKYKCGNGRIIVISSKKLREIYEKTKENDIKQRDNE